jgi:hypothetical protein
MSVCAYRLFWLYLNVSNHPYAPGSVKKSSKKKGSKGSEEDKEGAAPHQQVKWIYAEDGPALCTDLF